MAQAFLPFLKNKCCSPWSAIYHRFLLKSTNPSPLFPLSPTHVKWVYFYSWSCIKKFKKFLWLKEVFAGSVSFCDYCCCKYMWQKHLEKGKTCFGLQFEGSVCPGESVTVAGEWNTWPCCLHQAAVRSKYWCWLSVHFLLLIPSWILVAPLNTVKQLGDSQSRSSWITLWVWRKPNAPF